MILSHLLRSSARGARSQIYVVFPLGGVRNRDHRFFRNPSGTDFSVILWLVVWLPFFIFPPHTIDVYICCVYIYIYVVYIYIYKYAIFYFPINIGNLIIPIDFHIFQRGGPTTNQYFRASSGAFQGSNFHPRGQLYISWKMMNKNDDDWLQVWGIPFQSYLGEQF